MVEWENLLLKLFLPVPPPKRRNQIQIKNLPDFTFLYKNSFSTWFMGYQLSYYLIKNDLKIG